MVGGLVGLAPAGCDTFTTAGGRVVDAAGRPVHGAVVIVRKGDKRTVIRTDSAGRFRADYTGGLGSADAVVSACLPGYASREVRIPDGTLAQDLTITLISARAAPAPRRGRTDTLPCP